MWWMGLIQTGVGIAQTAIAASKETTPVQKYSMTPENRLAGQMNLRTAQQGASPEEILAFNQRLANQTASANKIYQSVGLMGMGDAANRIMNNDAQIRFAEQNSNIKRQGEAAYTNWAQVGQGLENKNVEENNALAMAEKEAKGAAIQAGIGNMIGGINSSSNAMLTNKTIDIYKEMFKKANNDVTQEPPLEANANQGPGYNWWSQGNSWG